MSQTRVLRISTTFTRMALALLLALVTLRAGDACAEGISGQGSFIVEVQTPFGDRFLVALTDMPVVYEPPTSVGVRGVLAFDGTFDPEDANWVLSRRVIASGGLVSLPAGPVAIRSVERLGDDVLVAVVLPTFFPDTAETFRIEGIELPRMTLRIEQGPPASRPTVAKRALGKRQLWMAVGTALELHAAPNSALSVTLQVAAPQSLPFVIEGSSDEWRLVKQVLPDGTAIHGWVPMDQLRAWTTGVATQATTESHVAKIVQGCTVLESGTPVRARLALGSKVYRAPRQEPWATVARADELDVLLLRADDQWARINDVPGLILPCGLGLYVPRSALTIAPRRIPLKR